MNAITKDQRRALKRIYDRPAIVPCPCCGCDREYASSIRYHTGMSYRQFRKTVTPMFGGDPCVMVKVGAIWIGIEADGYAHS